MCLHLVNVLLICLNSGQVITASIADIIANYSFKDILRKLAREKQTDVAPASYDDSYLGKIHYYLATMSSEKSDTSNVDATIVSDWFIII